METTGWAEKNGISTEPIAGINPMHRIQWGIEIFNGTVTKVFNGPYNRKDKSK